MHTLLIFFVFVVGTYASPSERIVNGENAKLGQFPYIVSIRYKGQHLCGGSIIDETHILTSAECFFQRQYDPLGFTVQYGVTDVTSTSNLIQVIKLRYYHMYDYYIPYMYDIGVLTLISPMTFSELAQPVKFPEQGDPYPIAQKAIFGGWGARFSNESFAENLQLIELTTYDDASCETAYPNQAKNYTHGCAGDVEKRKGICDLDMGGPLIVDGVQIGIAVHSKQRCTGYPPLFTRVSTFVSWIWTSGMCT